jgi:hypothetical protein
MKTMNEEHEISIKIDSLINECENGLQLYKSSPMFNAAINAIARGASELQMIEQMSVIVDNVNKNFSDHLLRYGPQFNIPKN